MSIPHYAIVTEDGSLHFEFGQQQRAYCRNKFGVGGYVDVEIREHREKRSDRQNRAMWALLHEWCSQRRDQGWREDDLKVAILGIAFGTVTRTMPITGEIVTVPAKDRSSRLNVTEFCHVIETILETAAGDDVYLQAPDEYRKAKELAAKQAAKKLKAAA